MPMLPTCGTTSLPHLSRLGAILIALHLAQAAGAPCGTGTRSEEALTELVAQTTPDTATVTNHHLAHEQRDKPPSKEHTRPPHVSELGRNGERMLRDLGRNRSIATTAPVELHAATNRQLDACEDDDRVEEDSPDCEQRGMYPYWTDDGCGRWECVGGYHCEKCYDKVHLPNGGYLSPCPTGPSGKPYMCIRDGRGELRFNAYPNCENDDCEYDTAASLTNWQIMAETHTWTADSSPGPGHDESLSSANDTEGVFAAIGLTLLGFCWLGAGAAAVRSSDSDSPVLPAAIFIWWLFLGSTMGTLTFHNGEMWALPGVPAILLLLGLCYAAAAGEDDKPDSVSVAAACCGGLLISGWVFTVIYVTTSVENELRTCYAVEPRGGYTLDLYDNWLCPPGSTQQPVEDLELFWVEGVFDDNHNGPQAGTSLDALFMADESQQCACVCGGGVWGPFCRHECPTGYFCGGGVLVPPEPCAFPGTCVQGSSHGDCQPCAVKSYVLGPCVEPGGTLECAPCHAACRSCTGPTDNLCTRTTEEVFNIPGDENSGSTILSHYDCADGFEQDGSRCERAECPARTDQCEAGSYESQICTSSSPRECSPCPAGTAQPDAAQFACTPCEPGTFSTTGATQCEQCPRGTSSGVGAATCTSCASGSIAASPGSTECTACPAGTVAEQGKSCSDCPPTTTSHAGTTQCFSCVGHDGYWLDGATCVAATPPCTGTSIEVRVLDPTHDRLCSGARAVAYDVRSQGCGATLTFDDGSGPGQPYPDNFDLEYWIVAADGDTIEVHFSSFETEPTHDTVTVTDVFHGYTSLVASLHGTRTIGVDVVCTSNIIVIRFSTDGATTDAGWTADVTVSPSGGGCAWPSAAQTSCPANAFDIGTGGESGRHCSACTLGCAACDGGAASSCTHCSDEFYADTFNGGCREQSECADGDVELLPATETHDRICGPAGATAHALLNRACDTDPYEFDLEDGSTHLIVGPPVETGTLALEMTAIELPASAQITVFDSDMSTQLAVFTDLLSTDTIEPSGSRLLVAFEGASVAVTISASVSVVCPSYIDGWLVAGTVLAVIASVAAVVLAVRCGCCAACSAGASSCKCPGIGFSCRAKCIRVKNQLWAGCCPALRCCTGCCRSTEGVTPAPGPSRFDIDRVNARRQGAIDAADIAARVRNDKLRKEAEAARERAERDERMRREAEARHSVLETVKQMLPEDTRRMAVPWEDVVEAMGPDYPERPLAQGMLDSNVYAGRLGATDIVVKEYRVSVGAFAERQGIDVGFDSAASAAHVVPVQPDSAVVCARLCGCCRSCCKKDKHTGTSAGGIGGVAPPRVVPDSELDKVLRLFVQEIRMAARFCHAHVVPVLRFSVSPDGTRWALISERMRHGDLKRYLVDHGRDLGALERLNILLGAAKGLAYLHTGADHLTAVNTARGAGAAASFGGAGWPAGAGAVPYAPVDPVAHRDITSSNVVLDDHNVARLLDLGTSKVLVGRGAYTQAETRTNFTVSTPGYRAPEVDTGRVSLKTDIFGFGVIMLEMLTGRPPVVDDRGEKMDLHRVYRRKMRDTAVTTAMADTVWPEGVATSLHRLALLCTEDHQADRPTSRRIVAELLAMKGDLERAERGDVLQPLSEEHREDMLQSLLYFCADAQVAMGALIAGDGGTGHRDVLQRECVLCSTQWFESEMLSCLANHVVCRECLAAHASSVVNSVDRMKASGFVFRCPHDGCDVPLPLDAMSRVLSDVQQNEVHRGVIAMAAAALDALALSDVEQERLRAVGVAHERAAQEFQELTVLGLDGVKAVLKRSQATARQIRLRRNTEVLYHQTHRGAADLILGSGRFMPGSHGLAGGGIYFAASPEDTVGKAQSTGVMFKCRVQLGNVLQLTSDGDRTMNTKKLLAGGHDSVKIGRTRPEWVVYVHSQVEIVDSYDCDQRTGARL